MWCVSQYGGTCFAYNLDCERIVDAFAQSLAEINSDSLTFLLGCFFLFNFYCLFMFLL